MAVDSFKRSSKIKTPTQFEVDFLLFYAQNKRKLSESDATNIVRGVGFEPTVFLKAIFKSRAYSVHLNDNFVV
jgi:hypothetical protein